jgi:Domain of unknown function (DUF5655)
MRRHNQSDGRGALRNLGRRAHRRAARVPTLRRPQHQTRAVSELWTCPECGHRFRWRNQSHSCTTYTVDDHLRGKPPAVVELYRAFEAAALAVGTDVEPEAVKTWISFRARMRFAGLAVQQRGLRCHVVLRRVLPHPRFVRIESIRTQHVHSFRIDLLEDVDDDLRAWLAEAYEANRHERR